jgi:translation initiation factor 3 subunit M
MHSIIILVLKTKLVRARMDQAARKVYVSSTMHRTFGRQQWQSLHDLLQSWRTNLQKVHDSMGGVVVAQQEIIQQAQ